MIKPHKYLDLNLSILNLGGIIIELLRSEGAIKFDELLAKVISLRGIKAKEVFIPTLSFLYLLGKVDYKQDIDVIEFKK